MAGPVEWWPAVTRVSQAAVPPRVGQFA